MCTVVHRVQVHKKYPEVASLLQLNLLLSDLRIAGHEADKVSKSTKTFREYLRKHIYANPEDAPLFGEMIDFPVPNVHYGNQNESSLSLLVDESNVSKSSEVLYEPEQKCYKCLAETGFLFFCNSCQLYIHAECEGTSYEGSYFGEYLCKECSDDRTSESVIIERHNQ